MPGKKYQTVDEYMQDFDGETRKRLEQLRTIALKEIPNAVERISYNIPAYFIGKTMVIYFAGYASHASLYPLHLISEKDKNLFSAYASGKATLKLPHAQPLPVETVTKFIRLRAADVAQ